jgi:hypothetical protein
MSGGKTPEDVGLETPPVKTERSLSICLRALSTSSIALETSGQRQFGCLKMAIVNLLFIFEQ